MELALDRPQGYLYVRYVAPNHVLLSDRDLARSFLLAPERAVEDWPVDDVTALGSDQVPALLALEPELVILGTGERQVFPEAAFLAGFLGKGVGIEVMTNAAAARTYNLLASESRKVVAAFILPAAGS